MGYILKVTSQQRSILEGTIGRPSRARAILVSAEGVGRLEIAHRLDPSPEQVSRIRSRFRVEGVEGQRERPKGGRKDQTVAAEAVELIVQLAMSPPPAGRSRWSSRRRMLDRTSMAVH